ncbi:asparaginase [Kineococcus sp. SYSU DK005]|uniref:asparaginase n=1 Tax=Kineococcus sp. SYSU DK005 TaxID=3383126 RepID=UPI003D7C588F
MDTPATSPAPSPAASPAPPPAHVPVATLTRGGLVESVHHGSVAVVGADGALLAAVGDVASPVYPRSALKPLQAVAMVRSGLDLPPDLLALACASHSGGEEHLSRVRRVLELGGLGPGDLRNTPDLPIGEAERAAWTAAGRGPQPLAQNCSGKHAAMLLTCRTAGWSTAGYLDPDHPLQRRVVQTVADLCGEPAVHPTADGCGAPLVAVSLLGLARALARIAGAAPGTPEGRVAEAMRVHPELVAGEGRDTTALARAVPGLVTKDGAEAVQVAATAAGAVALKVGDGGGRARVPVACAALELLGVDPGALRPLAAVPVLGGGRPVGELRALALRPAPA